MQQRKINSKKSGIKPYKIVNDLHAVVGSRIMFALAAGFKIETLRFCRCKVSNV